VAQGTSGGGGAGTSFSANPSISYNDNWANTSLNASYNYTHSNNNTIQKQFGENYTAGATPDVKNTSYFTRENVNNSINDGHRVALNYSHTFDKANNIQIITNFNYSNGTTNNSSYNDRINNYAAFEHITTNSTNSNNTNNTTYGISGFYQHIFKNPRRNFSVQFGINSNDTKGNGRTNNTFSFYADATQNNKLRADSVAELQTRTTSNNTTFNTTVTYLEPLTQKTQIEFSGSISRTLNDNVAKYDSLVNGQLKELTRLSNIFNYAFTQARLRLNYTYKTNRVTLSAGATALPTILTGTKVNNNNNQTVSSSLNNFRVIPVFSFDYLISATETATLRYSGNNTIPDFQQIQPFTDRSDRINITTGNPNLKPTFTNNISASYSKYIPESKINISISVNASDIKNRVVSNQLLYPGIKLTNIPTYGTVYETTYVNLDGSYALGTNYTFSKQLADKRYNLMFNGSVNYSDYVNMNNNLLYHQTGWRVYQRFGPKINTEAIEVNPYVSYDVTRSFTTLASRSSTNLETISLAVDGRFFFGDWRPNYSVSKNFVKGLGSLNTNPLIINAGIDKQLSKKNSLFLTFNVYDILKQNNFVQQSVTATSVTNTLSNTLSRYFMIGLRANFQHWGGRPTRDGKELKRKGDGSFIY
ncbi:MAG: outer membrane beta-barrel protein, partial [Mucilaginibacter sp.]